MAWSSPLRWSSAPHAEARLPKSSEGVGTACEARAAKKAWILAEMAS